MQYAEQKRMIRPEDKIALKVRVISKIDSKSNEFIMILSEKSGVRQLPMPLTKREAEDVLAVIDTEETNHATWTQTIKSLTAALDVIVEEVIINEVALGNYLAEVHLLQNGVSRTFQIQAIQALILALSQRSSIYIVRSLMEKQYVRPKGNGLISVPLNTLTIEMLQEALDKAIKDEDYELASHLRDEIKRRI